MDVHGRRAITIELPGRGVDVITDQSDEAAELDDPALLNRATLLNRVLFSQDQVSWQRLPVGSARIFYLQGASMLTNCT